MKIILISGKAGSGKDLTAKNMKKTIHSFGEKAIIIHFADYLKYILVSFFDWDGNKDENGRTLLQFVGEEFRNYKATFWSESVAELICVLKNKYEYIILPDWRYRNERETMIEYFGRENIHTVRVDRNFKSNLTEKQKASISETELDNEIFDYVIGAKNLNENAEQSNKILEEIMNG